MHASDSEAAIHLRAYIPDSIVSLIQAQSDARVCVCDGKKLLFSPRRRSRRFARQKIFDTRFVRLRFSAVMLGRKFFVRRQCRHAWGEKFFYTLFRFSTVVAGVRCCDVRLRDVSLKKAPGGGRMFETGLAISIPERILRPNDTRSTPARYELAKDMASSSAVREHKDWPRLFRTRNRCVNGFGM